MTDIFTKEKRSEIMSKIRGKDTKVELLFRKALSAEVYPKGYRYRLHQRGLQRIRMSFRDFDVLL